MEIRVHCLLLRATSVGHQKYVKRARVLSTLSRYGVTILGNVTSVYPPLGGDRSTLSTAESDICRSSKIQKELTVSFPYKDRQTDNLRINVTLMRFRATSVAVEKQ